MVIAEYEFEIIEGITQKELESFFAQLRRLEIQEYVNDDGKKRREERKASPERNGDYIRAGIKSEIMKVSRIVPVEGSEPRLVEMAPEEIDGIDPRVTVTMAGQWDAHLIEMMTPIVPN